LYSNIKRQKQINIGLIFILTFTLIFGSIGIYFSPAALADPLGKDMPQTPVKIKIPKAKKFPSKIKERIELKSKRGSNYRQFLEPDGSITAEIFQEPVFFKNKSGNWNEIDNRLKQSGKSGFGFENSANKYKVFLGENGASEKMAKFGTEDHWVTFTPVTRDNVPGIIKENTITYKNIQPNVDLKYQIGSTFLKEEIVLNRNSGQNTFSFKLETKNLKYQEQEDGRILFTDSKTGEKIF